MIEGVIIKELDTYPDERGFFREIVRVTDDIFSEKFGQWSHTVSYTGVIKAWHIHKRQIDWWYVAIGSIKAVLYDTRPKSPTYGKLMEILMGDYYGPKVLKIPPGVAHGYKVIYGPVHLFYITSQPYDPSDEGRIAHNDPTLGYDWLSVPVIK